jgi:hypothetical protein
VENKLKIGVIVAVAFSVGIIGTLSITNFDNNETNFDSQSPTEQSLAIGAYVTVDAFHEDGTLYQKTEGHNLLGQLPQNIIVGCLSGLDTTPTAGFSCSNFYDTLFLSLKNQTTETSLPRGSINTLSPSITGSPEDCVFDNGGVDRCTGWKLEATFDFAGLDCESGVTCYNATASSSIMNSSGIFFNQLIFDEEVPVGPDDRLIVTMDFSVPL